MVNKVKKFRQDASQVSTPSDRASAASAIVIVAAVVFGVDVPVDVAAATVVLSGFLASVVTKKKGS